MKGHPIIVIYLLSDSLVGQHFTLDEANSWRE